MAVRASTIEAAGGLDDAGDAAGAPILFHHGTRAGYEDGRWLTEMIPGVESRFEPSEGHVTRIHDWLLARL